MTRDDSHLDKRRFTVNERILLHLKESGSSSHSIDLPAPMTQDGIAGALGILVNHVSRAVKALQKQGCIREATARVKGEIRRRKIYLITEEGMAVANNVHNRISETPVSVRDSRQRLREMPASEAKKLLLPPRTYTAMLANLDERGVLDVYKAKSRKRQTASVCHMVGAPPPAPFHGRAEELKGLRAWLQLRKPPVMVLTGHRGIGKTVLALQAVTPLEGRRPIFWFSITPARTAENLVAAVAAFLRELGRTEFDIAENEGVQEMGRKLEASMIDLGALLVLDGLTDELEDIEEIVRVIIKAAIATGNQVMVTTRNVTAWQRELRAQESLSVIELRGLDRESCRKIAPHLDEQEFMKAYKLARGNPSEIKTLSEFADETIGKEDLTPEERALLRYLRAVHESESR